MKHSSRHAEAFIKACTVWEVGKEETQKEARKNKPQELLLWLLLDAMVRFVFFVVTSLARFPACSK